MNFRVIRPFRDLDGVVKMPGCTLEIEFGRASMLRRLGLIGQVAPERAVIVPKKKAVPVEHEKAVKPPGETRSGHKPKKKAVSAKRKKAVRSRKLKKQEIVSPESAEESVENGAETDNATTD